MLDKFDLYAILGIVVPGIMLAYWVPVCFPSSIDMFGLPSLPSAVEVIAFTALALFIGNVIQALASMMEPLVYWSWGGMPSDQALRKGLGKRYLPADTAHRVRAHLIDAVGEGATDRALFLWAMRRAAVAPNSRSEHFNSLFAYHRGLLVVLMAMTLMLLASTQWGAAATWSRASIGTLLLALVLLVGLIWHRAKQWAFYYVREVLLTAEHVIKDKNPAARSTPITGKE